MGGIGSGEWARDKKATVEDFPCLTVECLKNGFFLSEKIRVACNHSIRDGGFATFWEEGGRFRATVFLKYTKQHFGGYRTWFMCSGCESMRSKLYLYHGCFMCRNCCGATHRSSQLSVSRRHEHQINKIRKRLTKRNHHGLLDAIPPRPKGMHKRTYDTLIERLVFHHEQAMSGLEKAAGRIWKALE